MSTLGVEPDETSTEATFTNVTLGAARGDHAAPVVRPGATTLGRHGALPRRGQQPPLPEPYPADDDQRSLTLARQSSYLTSFSRTHPRKLPAPILEQWSWQSRGKCLGYPPEVFFPDEHPRRRRREREEEAKRICYGCPVMVSCREHALKTPENYGIWGALTAHERARLLSPRSGLGGH